MEKLTCPNCGTDNALNSKYCTNCGHEIPRSASEAVNSTNSNSLDGQSLDFVFNGKASDLFKIFIVNLFLMVVTLGLYYPWAKAKILNFKYGETEFKGSKFTFHGTGKEMFRGFIKVLAFLIIWYSLFKSSQHYLLIYAQQTGIVWPFLTAILGLYLILALFIPLAIVGSVKYRASKSSWRGIHFQYVGSIKSMYKIFLKGVFFSIITFGIYVPWFRASIYKEVAENLRWGNIKFKFTGDGGNIWSINFLGMLLTFMTMGIYYFRFMANYHNYILNHINLSQNEKEGNLKAETTGMGFFKLLIGNAFIILFTLGLGMPIAIVRQLNYYTKTLSLTGNIDFDSLEQGEIIEVNAVGDGLMDALDIDLI